MAELDKRIEGVLLQRLAHIVQVWCAEFDRTDDGDNTARRDGLPSGAGLRDVVAHKRRGGKGVREDKVCSGCSDSIGDRSF